MTRFAKLKEKIEQELTQNNITYDELSKYLNHYGYSLDRINGSHYVFKNNKNIIVIPVHNKRIKYIYVKKAVQYIKTEEKLWR